MEDRVALVLCGLLNHASNCGDLRRSDSPPLFVSASLTKDLQLRSISTRGPIHDVLQTFNFDTHHCWQMQICPKLGLEPSPQPAKGEPAYTVENESEAAINNCPGVRHVHLETSSAFIPGIFSPQHRSTPTQVLMQHSCAG